MTDLRAVPERAPESSLEGDPAKALGLLLIASFLVWVGVGLIVWARLT